MSRRSGTNPKRRIVNANIISNELKEKLLLKVRYVGSGHHKRIPANYGLERVNPRPTKSLCDGNRVISLEEATQLIRSGIERGLISEPSEGGMPKYIWSVSADGGEVFESKTHQNTPWLYHGYPLEPEDEMRKVVLKAWSERCRVI